MPSLVWAALVTGLWTVIPSQGRAEILANTQGSHSAKPNEFLAKVNETAAKLPTGDRLIAQTLYPPVSDDQGLMVQGQGEGSAPADIAMIEFLFSNGSNPFESPPEGKTPSPTKPLTQKSLQPVVDALVAIGVPASAIAVSTSPTSSQSFPFPFPLPSSGGSAQLVVKLDKPTRDRVQQIVTIGSKNEQLKENLSMQSVSVDYKVNDCQSLEKSAYLAAVNDARNRAKALAEALGVKIADVPSIAESPFASFFGSASSCNSKPLLSFFPFGGIKQPYDPAAPAEVRVKKDILVTYKIR